jgi:hypothetical protein
MSKPRRKNGVRLVKIAAGIVSFVRSGPHQHAIDLDVRACGRTCNFQVSASDDEADSATSANSATDAQNRSRRNVGPGDLRARNIAT